MYELASMQHTKKLTSTILHHSSPFIPSISAHPFIQSIYHPFIPSLPPRLGTGPAVQRLFGHQLRELREAGHIQGAWRRGWQPLGHVGHRATDCVSSGVVNNCETNMNRKTYIPQGNSMKKIEKSHTHSIRIPFGKSTRTNTAG